MPVPDDAILPDDSTVTLLATENGAQLLVAGKLRNQEKLLRYFGKSREGRRREDLESTAQTLRRLRKDALALERSSAGEVSHP
jgi:hypothetical protein